MPGISRSACLYVAIANGDAQLSPQVARDRADGYLLARCADGRSGCRSSYDKSLGAVPGCSAAGRAVSAEASASTCCCGSGNNDPATSGRTRPRSCSRPPTPCRAAHHAVGCGSGRSDPQQARLDDRGLRVRVRLHRVPLKGCQRLIRRPRTWRKGSTVQAIAKRHHPRRLSGSRRRARWRFNRGASHRGSRCSLGLVGETELLARGDVQARAALDLLERRVAHEQQHVDARLRATTRAGYQPARSTALARRERCADARARAGKTCPFDQASKFDPDPLPKMNLYDDAAASPVSRFTLTP